MARSLAELIEASFIAILIGIVAFLTATSLAEIRLARWPALAVIIKGPDPSQVCASSTSMAAAWDFASSRDR